MNAQLSDRMPLMNDAATEEGARQRPRRHLNEEGRYEPPAGSDWNPDLPYGGKVYLARKKMADPWWVLIIEVGISCNE